MDEATRNRRQRKLLEALEKDNFQDDMPSSIHVSDYRLQLNKKFQQRFALIDDANAVDSSSTTTLKENTSSSSLNNLNSIAQSSAGSSEIVNSFINEPNTGTKKKKLKTESKLRFRKNFATLLDEEVHS